MVYEIRGDNVPSAYHEFLWTFKDEAARESSRNGEVLTIRGPSLLRIDRPEERVLFNAARDANPFFHAMEFVWMMSGSLYVDWIAQFNKQMREYSDDGYTLPQSYGYRWREAFGYDQIARLITHLKRDLSSRRAVLGMWDPDFDLSGNPIEGKDKPCNTHLYFRVIRDALSMTACVRSNDAIWGMFGANCVHMTFLQELVARSLKLEVGPYYVMTNNLHVYTGLPNVDKIMSKPGDPQDYYKSKGLGTFPLLNDDEDYHDFVHDCIDFVNKRGEYKCRWINEVAEPIKDAYLDKEDRNIHVSEIRADDWRVACQLWSERRESERARNL